ncbi:UDP-glycosyltransferase 91C1-like [Iris pallida]|uniref:UDP-glycosyltransferase 91C1-like n=1 Tax=Iris pallida TaxID=29817 RepID=A0AAX6F5B5_IRIPA|nr:UDP-glycosyltransferase 91C1-like [Iris pallida]
MDGNGRSRSLHIVMLPWAALGHLLPFLELSKRLAKRGHRVSYISTPRNIQRLLPTVPPHLSHLIELLPFPLPPVDGLPDSAEATIDLPTDDLRPYLRTAYDTLQQNLHDFLSHNFSTTATSTHQPVDWLVYDYAAYWAPRVAARFRVPCAYLGLFNAAVLAFNGPPAELLGNGQRRMLPEEFTVVPGWVPFASTIAYRLHEVRKLFEPSFVPDASGVTEGFRFAASIEECGFVAVRSCVEFEAEWLDLLGKLLSKPIVTVGMLPPAARARVPEGADGEGAFKWLDEQEPSSVVYAAFGSEVKLTREQVQAIALGLELSQLPYLWALRAGTIPEGIREGARGRGLVCTGWVPQSRILAHPSVCGFLTHGGWNSIVEGLSLGRAMVVLPLIFDQGLNARNLVQRKLAVEVPRDDDDGSFTGEGIADSLRLVMVEAQGEGFRTKARECVDIFGNEDIQDRCLDDFVHYLWENRKNSEYSEQSNSIDRVV